MFFKKLLERIKIFFKMRFCTNDFAGDDCLSAISAKLTQVHKIEKISNSRNKNMAVDSTIALRYFKLVKRSADMMKYTTCPETFACNYAGALDVIEKVCELKHIDKQTGKIARDIADILKGMPKSCEDCAECGLAYYCVTFGGKRKEYYYLSGNKRYEIGQYVIAPAGDDMERTVVKIVGIEHYTPTNAPMPPEILKTIISPAIK